MLVLLPCLYLFAADGVVELTLTKAEGMHWWKAVLAEDPEIDVQAVEPESSKLTDLDPETRQTVEKMMVSMRRRAAGPVVTQPERQEPSVCIEAWVPTVADMVLEYLHTQALLKPGSCSLQPPTRAGRPPAAASATVLRLCPCFAV